MEAATEEDITTSAPLWEALNHWNMWAIRRAEEKLIEKQIEQQIEFLEEANEITATEITEARGITNQTLVCVCAQQFEFRWYRRHSFSSDTFAD